MVDDPTENDKAKTSLREAQAEGRPPQQEILELDHIYEALAHPHRRYLCYSLLEDSQWTLTDLATKIAAWENDIPDHAVTERQRERVHISLYHSHVPQLVDTDVITFDTATETIAPAENAEQVLAALEGMGAGLDSMQETHARDDMEGDER